MFSIYFLIQSSPISNIILYFSAVERENPNRLFIRRATEGELSSEAIHARLLTSDVAAPCAGLLVLQGANWVHLSHCYY